MSVSTLFPRSYMGSLQAVPTSSTAITTKDTQIVSLYVFNPTSGAITFTLTDGQGSPVSAFSAYSMPAGGFIVIDDENGGIVLTSGMKWQAGGSGLTGAYRVREKLV